MQSFKRSFAQSQRGISLIGLIVVLAILGFVGILAAKILPAYMEFSSIKKAVADAKATGGSVTEMRRAYWKAADIQGITSLHESDLVISRETGDTEISFAYDKVIPLVGNASLVLDFAGTTAEGGAPAAE
jgi:type II secretory pathway pseudopilin PulG